MISLYTFHRTLVMVTNKLCRCNKHSEKIKAFPKLLLRHLRALVGAVEPQN
jgi:hypothetical protein